MKIVTLNELCELPVGTVFSEYTPCILGDIHIKTCKLDYGYRIGWNGELTLDQPMIKEDLKDNTILYSNWSTVDSSDINYDEDQLFAVWNKDELLKMREWLDWVINFNPEKQDDTEIDMDHWFGATEGELYTDEEVEEKAGY